MLETCFFLVAHRLRYEHLTLAALMSPAAFSSHYYQLSEFHRPMSTSQLQQYKGGFPVLMSPVGHVSSICSPGARLLSQSDRASPFHSAWSRVYAHSNGPLVHAKSQPQTPPQGLYSTQLFRMDLSELRCALRVRTSEKSVRRHLGPSKRAKFPTLSIGVYMKSFLTFFHFKILRIPISA